jgi:Holliday junction DNA helicase RuvB
VLESLGIDERGFCRLQREYLAALAEAGRPLSLGTLADRLGKSAYAIRTVHEPFLIRRGLVARTPRGRVLLRGQRGQISARTDCATPSP